MDATYRAIDEVSRRSVELIQYEIRAVTSGTEAMGEVTVRLRVDEIQVVGRGASTDVVEASARAYVDGLNRLATKGGLKDER